MSNVPRLLNVLRRTGRPPAATGVVHDFASTCWGHNLTITAIQDEGLRIRAACWVGRRPQAGDQVILRGDGQTARYRVLDVGKAPGVDDMYYLNLLFDPRVHKSTGHAGG
jgi:hypothetical protein